MPPADDAVATAMRPTLEQVGAIMRARTKDQGGNELGTWTADTRPTDTEVTNLITQAIATVRVEVQEALVEGEPCLERAWVAVVYETACMIEKSYFPEQMETGRSPYDAYRLQYEGSANALARCLGVAPPYGAGAQSQASGQWGSVPVAMAPMRKPGEPWYVPQEEMEAPWAP